MAARSGLLGSVGQHDHGGVVVGAESGEGPEAAGAAVVPGDAEPGPVAGHEPAESDAVPVIVVAGLLAEGDGFGQRGAVGLEAAR